MSNLSEEEAIKNLNELISWKGKKVEIRDYEIDAIQGLLDLYNKEKEKNYILELEIDKLNQEKEQYKIVGQTNFVNAFKERNYISKDKIREKINEIEKRLRAEYDLYERAEEKSDTQHAIHRRINMLNFVEDELKELLEE